MAAIEHAADAIVVTDRAGTIRYVNPAFERAANPGPDCVIGQNIRILTSDGQPPATAKALLAAIGRGETWAGDLVIRRADGTLAHAEATAAPVRDAAGTAVGGVVVLRDISRQRALQTELDEYRRERAALAAALGEMRAGETAEATARAIGLALLGLAAFGAVGLFGFEPSGDVVPLAALDRAGDPVALPGSLPSERSAYLRERASHGPWIEDWNPGADHPYAAVGGELGIRVLAYVPIRSSGDTVGLLVVSGGDGDGFALAERLPALVECAALAGALLGPPLRSRGARALGAARIRAIIAARAFLPVFQPIVELPGRTVVGYEALTRFADGSPPDEVFAEAARCGLALDLEAVTLEAVLEASGSLPANVWLNLNVSAELVLAGEPLASILRRWGWQIVLELTEHIAVTDYPALRAALERLGPKVRLAVDDAGAGFASLRHILELRPDYVKLDRAIVRHINRDPARQALVAGLVHFAGQTGAVLVAEGVETEAEARQLRQLGVSLAQGYRLGRPALAARIATPLASVTHPAAGRAVPRASAAPVAEDDIARAVNIGSTLAAALRDAGIANVAELRALGSVAAWERLRQRQPGLATGATLLQLEGATRGMRVTQLAPAERARLRLFARLGREGPQPGLSPRRRRRPEGRRSDQGVGASGGDGRCRSDDPSPQ
jgi:PAS domain S-box-containing protein